MSITIKERKMNVHARPKGQPLSLDALADGQMIDVNPMLAGRLLRETSYVGQRPIDERHALTLGLEMEQGTFLPGTQIAFARLNGQLHLINGRHRLHAVELSGATTAFRIAVYEAVTDGEIGALYCRFDTMQRGRTARQIIGAVGLVDDDPEGLSNSGATLLYSAVPLLMVNFERIAHGQRPAETRIVDRKVEFARPWKQAAIGYQRCLGRQLTKYARRFRAAGVVAVALATFRHQPMLAQDFWSKAVLDDGLRANDPRHALYVDLIARRASSGSEFDLAAVAATAWNAFHGRKTLKSIKISGGPIMIAGTPYGGDR